MVLVGSAVQDKDGLIIVLLPGEDLSGRVNDVLVADGIIADVDLRVATVHDQAAAILGDLNIAIIDSANLQTVFHGFGRAVLRVARDVELGRVCLCWRDSDGISIGVIERKLEAVGFQEGRRHVEEVSLQLHFTVFLAPDETLLGDLGAVIVRGEALSMA
jgi:hypothetical protein